MCIHVYMAHVYVKESMYVCVGGRVCMRGCVLGMYVCECVDM